MSLFDRMMGVEPMPKWAEIVMGFALLAAVVFACWLPRPASAQSTAVRMVPGMPLPDKPTLMDCTKGCSVYYYSYIEGRTGKRKFAHIHIRSKQPVEVWESSDYR